MKTQTATAILRFGMGIVYFWFGVLKILGKSPIEEMIYKGTPFGESEFFMLFLGIWEVVIGICLFIKPWMRAGLWLLVFHFPGTFLPLFLAPNTVFTQVPFALTLRGQYIFKNLISIGGWCVLVSTLEKKERRKTSIK